MAEYNFTQAVAATTWTIEHNMDAAGVVMDIIVDNTGTLEKVIPLSTVETDSNTITVTFPSAQSGYARLIEGGSQVTASIGYVIGDISLSTYDSKSYNTTGATDGMYFKADGTTLFVVNQSITGISQHTLSTPWDISTASNDSISFGTINEGTSPKGVYFKSDGTKMYVLNTDRKIHQYSLGTDWDITTATYDSVFGTVYDATNIQNFTMTDDGARLYTVSSSTDSVHQYSLGTDWNIGSLTYDSKSFAVGGASGTPRDIIMSPDGSQMVIVDDNDFESEKVFLYDLGTDFDVTTATQNSTLEFTFNVYPANIAFNDDGTKLYIADLLNIIYQYSTNI